ncbi:50S ribosomal protein L21 [Rickettsiales bacterium (ex Bugula neritina AB1)]|nr:50S ribosomal protein L21 [Rickettsiales bacterium (ex Bugula neritina AB1)]
MTCRAIIKIGGRDFFVKNNSLITVFNVNKNEGDTIVVNDVITFNESGKIIDKSPVTLKIERNFKDKKIITFKMKTRTHTRRKKGIRPQLSQLRVVKLGE